MTVRDWERTLRPGVEVRYFSNDRQWLLPAETTATSESGLALVGVDGWAIADFSVAEIGGTTTEGTWDPVWMGFADDWVFVEELRRP